VTCNSWQAIKATNVPADYQQCEQPRTQTQRVALKSSGTLTAPCLTAGRPTYGRSNGPRRRNREDRGWGATSL